MKVIDNKTLDQLCQGYDEILRTADLNDRIYDRIIISFFVQELPAFSVISSQSHQRCNLPAVPCGLWIGYIWMQWSARRTFDQTVQRDLVPIFHIFFYLL